MSDSLSPPFSSESASRGGRESPGYWRSVAERIRRDWLTMSAAAILLAIILSALCAPLLSAYSPYAGNVLHRLEPVGTPGHWLGTDDTGRDIWTRLLYGGRLSLLIGFAPVLIGLAVGGLLGIAAGFLGGTWNSLIMRTTDVFYAFPSVLLAVGIAGVLGSGLLNVVLALTVVFTPPIVRISESVTAQVRTLSFVEAARASGATVFQVIRHHVLSNVLGTILTYVTSLFSLSIILGSGLSFLGLGVNPPYAEWGLMLNGLRQAIYIQPLVAALPGVMIFVASMCFNLMSDGLRSAMDIRLAR